MNRWLRSGVSAYLWQLGVVVSRLLKVGFGKLLGMCWSCLGDFLHGFYNVFCFFKGFVVFFG